MRAKTQLNQSPLSRAIADAEAFLPICNGLSAAHDAAEEALPRWDAALNARRDAARAAVPMPACLTFKRDPADQITYMEIRYGDGTVKKVEGLGADYTPECRWSLAKHCEEKRLDAKPYLDEWDLWQAQREEAAEVAAGPEVAALTMAFEKAEAAWDRALAKRRRLAQAVLQAPVESVEEAIVQIEAYRRIEEIKDLADTFDEDKLMMLDATLRALATLAGPTERQRLAA